MRLGRVSISIVTGALLCCAAACAQKPGQSNAAPTPDANVATLIESATARFQQGDFEGAKSDLRAALALDAANVDAAGKLSAISVYTGDLSGARAVIDAAIAQQTEPGPRAKLMVGRATVAFMAGDAAQARADSRAGVAANPDDYVAWEYLAYTDVIAGDYTAAVHSLSQANRNAPTEKFIHLVLLQSVLELRLGRDGRATLRNGLALHPTDLWPQPVTELVFGRVNIQYIEMRLENTPWPADFKAESRCDIYFYAAELGLADRTAGAQDHLKRAAEICRPSDPELLMARAELARLP
jgi:Tfp pilus assembly protein PilF